eukprot:472717_1
MARNPLSLYTLQVCSRGSGNFSAFIYDHIQHLILGASSSIIVENRNWNNTVREITFHTTRFSTLSVNTYRGMDMVQQSFNNICNIFDRQMTVDNITKLNIRGATDDVPFYKFILRSFKHVEMLTISDRHATHIDLSGTDPYDIHIFNHLKQVHVCRSGEHISMMHFAKGLIDLNNSCFERPIEFVMSMAMDVDRDTNFQKIIENIFRMYSQFNKIYLKITYHCWERMHFLHQTITNLLQYLSLKQDQFCLSFVSIETRLDSNRSYQLIDRSIVPLIQLLSEHKGTDKAGCPSPVDTNESLGDKDDYNSEFLAQLLYKDKPCRDKAINIMVCIENECYSGYLCSASDITLTNEYNSWKMLTETIDDGDKLIV